MYSLTPSSSSSSSSSPTTPTPSRASFPYDSGVGGGWGPYSSSKEFDINMASILIILVLATFLAFVLHAAIRFLLRLYRRRRLQSPTAPSPNSLQKRNKDSAPSIDDGLPTLVFSAGTKLAGGAEVAECAICLSEFVEGDGVRVLPACNHGFHVKCVEGWLASKSSCPTCRTSHRPAAAVGAAAEP